MTGRRVHAFEESRRRKLVLHHYLAEHHPLKRGDIQKIAEAIGVDKRSLSRVLSVKDLDENRGTQYYLSRSMAEKLEAYFTLSSGFLDRSDELSLPLSKLGAGGIIPKSSAAVKEGRPVDLSGKEVSPELAGFLIDFDKTKLDEAQESAIERRSASGVGGGMRIDFITMAIQVERALSEVIEERWQSISQNDYNYLSGPRVEKGYFRGVLDALVQKNGSPYTAYYFSVSSGVSESITDGASLRVYLRKRSSRLNNYFLAAQLAGIPFINVVICIPRQIVLELTFTFNEHNEVILLEEPVVE